MDQRFVYTTYLDANGHWPCKGNVVSPAQNNNPGTRSSYSYYPESANLINAATGPSAGYMLATKATQLVASRPMMSDILQEWVDIPHRSGKTPAALNVLWGDGHASVAVNPGIFNQSANYWDAAASFFQNPSNGPGDHENQFFNIIAQIQL